MVKFARMYKFFCKYYWLSIWYRWFGRRDPRDTVRAVLADLVEGDAPSEWVPTSTEELIRQADELRKALYSDEGPLA